jgi:hypothetical protein
MNAASLHHLPALLEACRLLDIETLTVCTLPPDLRLASPPDADALTDALRRVAPLVDCEVRLLGRRYFLPDDLAPALVRGSRSGPRLRLAVDYACRPSLLPRDPDVAEPSLLLLPRGLKPGNLLRWHFARARQAGVDWHHFDAAALRNLLTPSLPRLIAARP